MSVLNYHYSYLCDKKLGRIKFFGNEAGGNPWMRVARLPPLTDNPAKKY